MNLFERIATGVQVALGRKQLTTTTKAYDPFLVVTNRSLQQGDAEITSPYAQSPWVYAGVRAIGRYVASTPCIVKRGTKRTREGQPVPTDDPWQRLLDKPSPLMSSYAFFEAISSYLDIYGEAYVAAYGEGARPYKSGDIPRELLVLPAGRMTPQIDPKSGLVMGYKLSAGNSSSYVFTAEQIGFLRTFNPDEPTRGLSPLSCVLVALGFDVKANAYNAALLSNGADPGGVLYSDQPLPSEEVAALRAQWEDRHKGAIRASRVAILSGGLKYERSTVTPKDMAFGDMLDRHKAEVLAALGVNPFDIGDTPEYNRAAALAARAQTWEQTVIPRLHHIEDALWSWLFEPYSRNQTLDTYVEFDLTKVEALQPNMTEKVQQANALVMMGYTLDQVNERLGLGMPAAPVEPEVPPPPPPAAEPPPPAPVEASARVVRVKAPKRLPRQVQSVKRRVTQFEKSKAQEVLDRLRAIPRFLNKAIGDLPELTPMELDYVLGTPAQWTADANEYLRGVMDPVATYALNSARNTFGGFEVISVRDPKWYAKAASQTASLVQVQSKRREAFRKVITRTFREGGAGSVDELSKRLDQAFGDEIPSSADTVARTESAMLIQDIKDTAAKDEGFTHKTWSTAGDLSVRASHAAIDGETVEIKAKFSNGLEYPSQMGGPPEEVINCRCDVVYRIMD